MRTTPEFVLFWKTAEIYSNWHPAVFTDADGIRFVNSEQYLMYHKALLMQDMEIAQQILKETNPGRIKALGQQVRNFDEALWDAKRLDIMETGCYLKFMQNPAMRTALLTTGQRTMAEASPVDCIWGIGLAQDDPRCEDQTQWLGRNLLGIALCHVRERIRAEMTARVA